MKFIDLPAQARKQIQTWISLTSETSGFQEETVPLEKPGQPAAATASRESLNANRVSENRAVLRRPYVTLGLCVLGLPLGRVGQGQANCNNTACDRV